MADSKKTKTEAEVVEMIETKTEEKAIMEEPKKVSIFKKIGSGIAKHRNVIIGVTTGLAAGALVGYMACKATHYESENTELDEKLIDLTSPENVDLMNKTAERASVVEDMIDAKVDEIVAKSSEA